MKRIILFFLVSLLLVSPVLAYSVPDDTIVYVTPSGTKYHRKDCSHTTTVTSLTIQAAESRGYTPCSRCDPDVLQGEYVPPETTHSSSGSSSSSHSSSSPNKVEHPVKNEEPAPNPDIASQEVPEDKIDAPVPEEDAPLPPRIAKIIIGVFVCVLVLPWFLLFFLLPTYLIVVAYVNEYRRSHHKKAKSQKISASSSPIVPVSEPVPAPAPPAPTSQIMVFFSLHSKTFHREGCGCLSRSKNVVGATITYAFNHQMTPCKVCRPMGLVPSYEYVRWQDVIEPNSIQAPDEPVYYALSSSFYHEKSCLVLQHQANIVSSDLKTAVLRHKRQCPVCKPVRRVPIKYSLSAPVD